jgi:hypothetical protein
MKIASFEARNPKLRLYYGECSALTSPDDEAHGFGSQAHPMGAPVVVLLPLRRKEDPTAAGEEALLWALLRAIKGAPPYLSLRILQIVALPFPFSLLGANLITLKSACPLPLPSASSLCSLLLFDIETRSL